MSQYYYDTEKQAMKVLKERQEEWNGVWCPLSRQKCIRKCVNFDPGRLYQVSNIESTNKGKWQVVDPSCENVLMSGAMTVYVEN